MSGYAALRNVCFWHKADVTMMLSNVRQADIDRDIGDVCF